MKEVKYVVYDECSELNSDFYNSYEDALYELEYEECHQYSSESVILEVYI